MAIGDRPEKKSKSLAFVSEENHGEDDLSEAITFIGKKFNKSLNKLKTRWRTNVPDRIIECPNYLKKQNKGMAITLLESDEENEEATVNKAFTSKYETSSNTSSEYFSDEDLTEAHKHVTAKWKKYCQVIKYQEKFINRLIQEKEVLTSTAANLKEEVTLLNSKLTNITESVRILNEESDILDEILKVGKMKGIDFDNYKEIKTVPKKTIPPKQKLHEQMSNHMPQHPAQQKNLKSDNMSQL
ncbi:gag-pol polyprotein [Trifolium medium]|uniref:Gag-pol polyprotein n=1 Tax=Trifolium medium TaxID=97028 RepID=A0A392NM83_9FABA|nr:gag-pol polyprotein [Trifolium medium]